MENIYPWSFNKMKSYWTEVVDYDGKRANVVYLRLFWCAEMREVSFSSYLVAFRELNNKILMIIINRDCGDAYVFKQLLIIQVLWSIFL